jgi:hypothetical protein
MRRPKCPNNAAFIHGIDLATGLSHQSSTYKSTPAVGQRPVASSLPCLNAAFSVCLNRARFICALTSQPTGRQCSDAPKCASACLAGGCFVADASKPRLSTIWLNQNQNLKAQSLLNSVPVRFFILFVHCVYRRLSIKSPRSFHKSSIKLSRHLHFGPLYCNHRQKEISR